MPDKFFNFIDLHNGEEDKKKVLENVRSNVSFRGTNLWILACAIVIASIGLNVNSTAVIIGAMLISPLMGPIVGAGFSLGIFDFNLLKRSLKNLFLATIVSLLVATVYFYLTPFKETQSELLARTSPNIYDVLIAFFGGLVGVVAITRVEKGNPIPGVAIATALMPPLCTAGYGLAIGNLRYFSGALFLYSINCVFICISTFIIVKYLKYPPVIQSNKKIEVRVRYIISILVLIMIIPSVYFAYDLIQEKNKSQRLDNFISNEFLNKGYTIIFRKINTDTIPQKIELAFLTKRFTENEIDSLNKKLSNYNIYNTVVKIRQDTSDLKKLIEDELKSNRSVVYNKDLIISELQNKINSNYYNNELLLGEVKILFPEIENISVSNHTFNENTDSLKTIPVILYKSKTPLSGANLEKLTLWLKQRLLKDQIELYRQNE